MRTNRTPSPPVPSAIPGQLVFADLDLARRDDGRLLTKPEAAERLGVKVRFIDRLVDERRIEFIHVGRHVRIAERAINDFIQRNTVTTR